MNKIRISVTAISLLLGLVHAFTVKASYFPTFWTTAYYHNMATYLSIRHKCLGGNTLCAVQYIFAFDEPQPTGRIVLKWRDLLNQ